VVRAGVGGPRHPRAAEQAAAVEPRGEPRHGDAARLVVAEAEAAALEVLDGVGCVRVRGGVEAAEVELPGGDVAEVVVDGEAELDGLEGVGVGLHRGVPRLRRHQAVALLTGAVDDAGVVDGHRGVAGVRREVAEEDQLGLQVVLPYPADRDADHRRRRRRHRDGVVVPRVRRHGAGRMHDGRRCSGLDRVLAGRSRARREGIRVQENMEAMATTTRQEEGYVRGVFMEGELEFVSVSDGVTSADRVDEYDADLLRRVRVGVRGASAIVNLRRIFWQPLLRVNPGGIGLVGLLERELTNKPSGLTWLGQYRKPRTTVARCL
jgi:hypothetical protein